MGLTYRISEHPEWGTGAFSLLEYNAGKAEGVQVWTAKYSSSIDDASGQLSDATYLADAKNFGDAWSPHRSSVVRLIIALWAGKA